MNKNDFNRFIGAGLIPGGADLEGARELTGLFPWFHSAHLVLLRGLRESSDIKFESQLKGSALYVADRSMLYHYLFLNVPESTGVVPVGVSEPGQVNEPSESGPETAIEPSESGHEPEIETPEPLTVAETPEKEPENETPEPEIIAGVPEEIKDKLTEDPDQVKEVTEVASEENIEPIVSEQGQETPEVVIEEVTVQEESNTWEPDKEEQQQDTVPLQEPRQQEPGQEDTRPEEQYAEDNSLKTRDELIAEIEARLVELEKEDLLELADGDEITVDPVPGEGSPELTTQEEISVDTAAGESPEVSNTETEETLSPAQPLKQLSPNDLIDRFIQTSPRIERMVPGEVPLLMDLTEHRTEEHTPFITETLARIYVTQGYYTRAINIYEKLTLQFPEKSAYFASRIEKIKELIK